MSVWSTDVAIVLEASFVAALGQACSGAGGSGVGGSVTMRTPEPASGAGGGRTGPLGLAASSSSGRGGGRMGPLGVVASSSSGRGGGGASMIAEAGGGGAGLCSALTVTTGETMTDSGTTMGSRISVLSSGPGMSGFWAGAVVVPAPLIMPIRSSTPSEDGSSAEEGTNRMFVSTTGGLSCDSLRFLIVTILYSRSTKVGLGGHIPGRKGPYRDLVYTRGSIGSVDA